MARNAYRECLCLKPKSRTAFLASLLDRKDVVQTCTNGHHFLTWLQLLFARQTLRGSNCLLFKEKASCLLLLDPVPADSSVEAHTTLCASPPFLSVFAKLICLTEHIHCSLPCTNPSDSFLKWLCVSIYLNLQVTDHEPPTHHLRKV